MATLLQSFVNEALFKLCALALVVAGADLTIGVLSSLLFGRALVWKDEVAVLLITGVAFLAAPYVQSVRGHIQIDVLSNLLPAKLDRARGLAVDALAFLFCAFFAWKSGALFREAVSEGYTSSSPWGPPLWVPYSLMALGSFVLASQIAVQLGEKSLVWLLFSLAAVIALLGAHHAQAPIAGGISQTSIGTAYCAATMLVMFSGLPIAFALGIVATSFMLLFMPGPSVDTIAQNVYEELANVTIVAIPLFILKGAVIGRSDAGRDLYGALHAWLYRVPGGLGVANTVACGLFSAMAGSSVATCSAIGSAGIPEMRKRGYPGGFAAGVIAAGGTLGILLPPSVTMLLFAVTAEVSLGRLFLASVGPGLLLVVVFASYCVFRMQKEKGRPRAVLTAGSETSEIPAEYYSLGEKVRMAVWVTPFVLILAGVMTVLYAGLATPSETAGVGAILALVVIGLMYRAWQPAKMMPMLLSTAHESSMLLMIIGMSLLYAYVMSYLHISQSLGAWIVGLGLSKWTLLAAILLFVMCLGFFLPPVSIILMTAPIILPPLKASGFDPVWFGVVMTIVMEMGLIHPPVGLNLFVIKRIAPDLTLSEVILGTLPFVLLMLIVVVACAVFPQIVVWLPKAIMG